MKVKSTGSAKAIIDLLDWRDLYAYARLVKENKPFKVNSMELTGYSLTVEFMPGRCEKVDDVLVSEVMG